MTDKKRTAAIANVPANQAIINWDEATVLDDLESIRRLGVATISKISRTVIYVMKDDTAYCFEPVNTQYYRLGERDFSHDLAFVPIIVPDALYSYAHKGREGSEAYYSVAVQTGEDIENDEHMTIAQAITEEALCDFIHTHAKANRYPIYFIEGHSIGTFFRQGGKLIDPLTGRSDEDDSSDSLRP